MAQSLSSNLLDGAELWTLSSSLLADLERCQLWILKRYYVFQNLPEINLLHHVVSQRYLCQIKEVKMNFISCSSRKVNYGQNSESLGVHFCANMKLHAHPAILANCLNISNFSRLECPPSIKIVCVFNLMT